MLAFVLRRVLQTFAVLGVYELAVYVVASAHRREELDAAANGGDLGSAAGAA